MNNKKKGISKGQMLVELIMAIGIAAIIIPALLTGLIASREGRPQQQQRAQAIALLKETTAAVRNIKDSDWNAFAMNGTFHPEISNNKWTLASSYLIINGLKQQVDISNVYRNSAGAIVPSGGTLDPSTKQAVVTVSWTQPQSSAISSTIYLTRTANLKYSHTTASDFNAGISTATDTQVTNVSGGEIKLANNNRAKWCSPSFTSTTIDLPDGPPVAVAATASATSVATPNDVYAATAPTTSSSTKLAYVTVAANVATPSATLKGTFTMDPTKYSSGTFPSGTGLDNNFKTNDIKYYTSSGGKRYALLATDLASKEVVVVQINNGTSDAYQDSVNKIYKYWTFFDTKRYSGASGSDQSPYGAGATSLTVLGSKGYVSSGGYLYVFDLSNIDSKSTSSGLDIVGCRIELDGYDCHAGSPGTDAKYDPGETGTSWSDTAVPVHNDCSDGGNIELNATNDIYPVQVGGSTYIYAAVGAGTTSELNIANVTSIPTSSTNPKINANTCGTIASGNSGWKRVGSLDFNAKTNTEEAANSVFAKADGTRAYISSNGGIDANNDGQPDSKQFYVINTSTPTAPAFLSGTSNSPSYGPLSGYYYGSGANAQLFPRRSLTVLNGDRAVLVGKDGTTDGNDAMEYQVLNMDPSSYTESTPTYCGGLNYDQGFNDLTSVSELDNDNFVYMVANTSVNELKIIEGGPDSAIYVANGTYESLIFDTASVDGSQSLRAFNRLAATISKPANTAIGLQTAVAPAVSNSCTGASYSYVGPDGTSGTQFTATTSALTGLIPLLTSGNYQNPGRCFRYKAFLSTTNQMATPELDDVTWNYSQ